MITSITPITLWRISHEPRKQKDKTFSCWKLHITTITTAKLEIYTTFCCKFYTILHKYHSIWNKELGQISIITFYWSNASFSNVYMTEQVLEKRLEFAFSGSMINVLTLILSRSGAVFRFPWLFPSSIFARFTFLLGFASVLKFRCVLSPDLFRKNGFFLSKDLSTPISM